MTAAAHDDEFARNVLRNFMELWFEPEVRRRQESGLLPNSVRIHAAQVIFYPDHRPNLVRLNDEVRIAGRVKSSSAADRQPGQLVYAHEIESIEKLFLTGEDDLDCAHVTALALGNEWHLSFDFRYFRGSARGYATAAPEFLAAARFSADQGNWRAFVDTAFSAAELAATALVLTSHLGEKPKKDNKHGFVHTKVNQLRRGGNASAENTDVFNWLARERSRARYIEGDVTLTRDKAEEILARIEEMITIAVEQTDA